MEIAIAIAAVVISIVGPFLVYFAARAKADGRQEAFELALNKTITEIEKSQADSEARVRRLEIDSAVDRKAVDGVTRAIEAFRMEMDRRFDQLERMINGTGSGVHKRSQID